MVILTYWRYKAEQSEEFDSVEDAVRFLAWGNERGELTHCGGRIVDGDRVVEGDELDRLVSEAWRDLA